MEGRALGGVEMRLFSYATGMRGGALVLVAPVGDSVYTLCWLRDLLNMASLGMIQQEVLLG